MEELKPCPFCGKQPRTAISEGCRRIYCANVDCEGAVETDWNLNGASAAAAWNTRAVDPLAQALYEALKGLAWRYADEPEVCDALKNWEASR